MDLGWKRVHLLLMVLMFWRHVIGREGRASHVQPRHFRKALSPRAVQSSLLEAPMAVNVPPEEVDPLSEKSLNPSRSRFSQSRQFVKGGFSSSYESMPLPQSAQSGSVSASWALPQNLNNPGGVTTLLQSQGSSSSNVQNVASQSLSGPGSYNQYDSTSKDRSGLQAGGTSSPVSTLGESGLSQSGFSQYTPGSSVHGLSPINTPGQSTSDQSSSAASFQSSSGSHFGGSSSQLYTRGSGSSQFFGVSSQFAPGSPARTKLLSSGSLSSQAANRQGSQSSSRLLTGSSDPVVSPQGGSTSFSGLSSQSQSALSQYTPVSPAYAGLGSSPLVVSSHSISDQDSQSLYTSGSQGGFSSLATSHPSGPMQGASSSLGGSYLQSQSSPSQVVSGSPQYTSASVASPEKVSSQYNKANEGAYSLSQTQPLQRWKPSTLSQGMQTVGTASRVRPSSQNVQTSSKFSSPSSASGPSQLTSTQGASSYQGLLQSQSSSGQYTSGSPVYSKFGSSPLRGSSQFTSGPSSPSLYAQSSHSGSGSALAASSQFASVQRGSSFNVGSSLQPQSVPSQYAPAPSSLDKKMPASSLYGQAPLSGTVSQSQPSRMWQPSTSRWTGGSFPTSVTAVSQSSSSPPSSQTPSRFLSPSAGGPSPLVSTGGSGLSQSLSPSRQYSPGSPAYAKFGSSLGLSPQSSSGQSSSSQYTSSSQSTTGSQLTSSTGYLSMQRGSGSSDGSSVPGQGVFDKFATASSLGSNTPMPSQTGAISSGGSPQSQLPQNWQTSASSWSQSVQTSGTAGLQGSSLPQRSETSSSSSHLPALSFPVYSLAQSGQTSVSRQTTGVPGLGVRPSKFSSLTASASRSQMSPGLSASIQRPAGSMSLSSGSRVQGFSEGMLSGPPKAPTTLHESVPLQRFSSNYDSSVQEMSSSQGVSSGSSMSSDLTSELSSSYGLSYSQNDPVPYRPSRGSSTSGRYYSSVKG